MFNLALSQPLREKIATQKRLPETLLAPSVHSPIRGVRHGCEIWDPSWCENPITENRRSERRLTLQTGKIVSSDEALSFDCAILDISDHGARLLVPLGASVPDAFTLFMDHDKATHECKVTWREGPRIGVSFD